MHIHGLIFVRARDCFRTIQKPLLFAVFSHSILSLSSNINKMVKQKMRNKKNEMADIHWNSSVFWCFFYHCLKACVRLLHFLCSFFLFMFCIWWHHLFICVWLLLLFCLSRDFWFSVFFAHTLNVRNCWNCTFIHTSLQFDEKFRFCRHTQHTHCIAIICW